VQIDWPQRNRRLGTVDALGLTGFLGFLVARFIPVARLPFWGCALRQTTGWPCPACGLTRVADHLSHFHFAKAWDVNPLGTVGACLFMAAVLAAALHLTFGLPLPSITLNKREAFALKVTLAVAVGVNYAFVVVKTKFPQLL